MCTRSPFPQLPVSVYESVIDIINGEVRMKIIKSFDDDDESFHQVVFSFRADVNCAVVLY